MAVLVKERFKVKCTHISALLGYGPILSLGNWKDMDIMGWKDYGVQDVSYMVCPLPFPFTFN